MALTNEQVSRIEREYQERRRQAAETQKRREAEVAEKVPGFAEADGERLRISRERASALLKGDSSLAGELAGRLSKISLRKRELLENAGYPASYLERPVRCPFCGDTGYVNGEKCRCFRQMVIDLFYRDSALWEAVRRENFGSFSYRWFDDQEPLAELNGKTSRENMRRNVRDAKNFISRFGEEPQNLLLTGKTGMGKTFLCNCIADALLKEGFSVLYMTASEFFDRMARLSFGNSGEDFEEVMAGADLLILDDLGMEITNSFVAASLFRTVNERCLKRRSTIISTNLSLSQIRDRYSERVSSRIMDHYRILVFAGDDIRVRKRQERTL